MTINELGLTGLTLVILTNLALGTPHVQCVLFHIVDNDSILLGVFEHGETPKMAIESVDRLAGCYWSNPSCNSS